MDNRYEDVTESVNDLLSTVRKNHFPELKNAKIKMLFDTKKRVSGGQIILAKILKPNDLIRFLTKEEVETFGEGYDYIIFLDKVCWDNIPPEDRIRIVRHELRHTYYDIESENDPYKIIAHTINDFYEEVELNQDDPRWNMRVAQLTSDIYEQRKEEARESRGPKKKFRPGANNLTVVVSTKTPIEEETEKRKEEAERASCEG